MCVSKLCVWGKERVMTPGGGGRRRTGADRSGPERMGAHNRKQEPHTKMWGKNRFSLLHCFTFRSFCVPSFFTNSVNVEEEEDDPLFSLPFPLCTDIDPGCHQGGSAATRNMVFLSEPKV